MVINRAFGRSYEEKKTKLGVEREVVELVL